MTNDKDTIVVTETAPAEAETAAPVTGSGEALKLPKRKRASLDARKARSGYWFVLPFLLGIALIYLPILLDSIWFSFNKLTTEVIGGLPVQVLKPQGLYYYKYALFESPSFVTKLFEGIQQLIFEVPAVIIFSLFIYSTPLLQ